MNEIVTLSGKVLSPDFERQNESFSNSKPFLEMVGERVRSARLRKTISRKQLSKISGVSQRYIAQLESGEGNISILLLRRIADALGHKIEWLVGEDDPYSSDIVAVTALYRCASEDVRRQVLEVLDPERGSVRRARRVALIGLRGAGKTTIGRLTAAKTNLPFVELNEEIERMGGMPVGEIMSLYGLTGYRRLEMQILEQIAANHDSLILTVSGGIVSEPETFNFLLKNYYTIWLRALPEEHMARVRAQGDERPMAGNPQAMDDLRKILASREPLYARADAIVNTAKRTVDEVLQDTLETIKKHRFLGG